MDRVLFLLMLCTGCRAPGIEGLPGDTAALPGSVPGTIRALHQEHDTGDVPPEDPCAAHWGWLDIATWDHTLDLDPGASFEGGIGLDDGHADLCRAWCNAGWVVITLRSGWEAYSPPVVLPYRMDGTEGLYLGWVGTAPSSVPPGGTGALCRLDTSAGNFELAVIVR